MNFLFKHCKEVDTLIGLYRIFEFADFLHFFDIHIRVLSADAYILHFVHFFYELKNTIRIFSVTLLKMSLSSNSMIALIHLLSYLMIFKLNLSLLQSFAFL